MSISEIRNLLRQSKRHVENNEWVTDELWAIDQLRLHDEYLKHVGTNNPVSNELSSSVAYLIGITDEPPTTAPIGLKVSGGRSDWPDIDLDFQDSRRNEVK